MPTDMNALIRGMLAEPAPIPTAEPPSEPVRAARSAREGEWVDLTPRAPERTDYVDPRDLTGPPIAEQYPYDNLPQGTGQQGPEIDPRFIGEVNRNPNGEQAGPMYLSPEAKVWMRNIVQAGFSVDWGTRTIFNPDTGEEYPVPDSFPTMT